jgi:adenylate cyclase
MAEGSGTVERGWNATHRSKGGVVSRQMLTPAAIAPSPAALRPARTPGARVVRRQLDLVLSSTDFDASRRSREFLRFIVEEALAGRGEELTQSAIATHVFARREDFDPMVDPIVRIQAGRLRRSLERYYMLAGKDDAVRIDLPRGAYLPAFREAIGPVAVEDRAPEPAADADDWPSVAISAFETVGTAGDAIEAAGRLTEEVVLELGRHRYVRTLVSREADPGASARPRGRFALGGRVRVEEGGGLRVIAHLVDRATGEQAWGDEFHTAPLPGRWSGAADDIARVIAGRVGSEEGIIVQRLAAERRKRGAAPTAFDAILRSYDFLMARDPETLFATLQGLRRLVAAEPDCGLAWTRLARLHCANHTFEATTIPTPLDQAITCAQQAVRVDPSSRRARCILATALLVTGEPAAARAELEDALRLSPDSLVYLEVIGYLLAVLGDGDRGAAMIRDARRRNPYCLPIGSFGLWYDHLRRGDVEAAYQAALENRDPLFFWRSLMRASCLGLLGRTAEAEVEVAELLRAKPDFETRGRRLIGYYVKPAEMMDRIVDGLARAGVTLA